MKRLLLFFAFMGIITMNCVFAQNVIWKKNPSRSPKGYFVSVENQFYTGDNHCILTADPVHYWDEEHPDSYYKGNKCDFFITLSPEVDPDEMGFKIFPGTDITAEPIYGEDYSWAIPYLSALDYAFSANYPHPMQEIYLNPKYIYSLPENIGGLAFPSLYPYLPQFGKEYLFKPGTYTYMLYAVVGGITYEATVEYKLSYKNDYNNMFPPPVPCECEDYCNDLCDCDGGPCDCDCIGIKDPKALQTEKIKQIQTNVYRVMDEVKDKNITVFDIRGSRVVSKSNEVNIGNLSKGMYFLQVENTVKKVIKE